MQSVTGQATFRKWRSTDTPPCVGCAACCRVGVVSVYAAFRDLSILKQTERATFLISPGNKQAKYATAQQTSY